MTRQIERNLEFRIASYLDIHWNRRLCLKVLRNDLPSFQVDVVCAGRVTHLHTVKKVTSARDIPPMLYVGILFLHERTVPDVCYNGLIKSEFRGSVPTRSVISDCRGELGAEIYKPAKVGFIPAE